MKLRSLLVPFILLLPNLIVSEALNVVKLNNKVTVSYPGSPGISSWKVSVTKDNGGNFSEIRVPMSNPNNISKESGPWPAFVISSGCGPSNGTWGDERENFTGLSVSTFEIQKQTEDTVILSIADTSAHEHYFHTRTYTFSKTGLSFSGEVIPFYTFCHLGVWNIFASGIKWPSDGKLPVKNMDSDIWSYMNDASNDKPRALPSGVSYPLETFLKMDNFPSIFFRIFFEKKFDAMSYDRLNYQRSRNILAMGNSLSSPKNQGQNYRIRLAFEDSSVSATGLESSINRKKTPGFHVYPNPFNSTVTIAMQGFKNENLKSWKLKLYSVSGKIVSDLSQEIQDGIVVWNAEHQSSGIYSIILQNEKRSLAKNIYLMK